MWSELFNDLIFFIYKNELDDNSLIKIKTMLILFGWNDNN